jgi:hypothetical protein
MDQNVLNAGASEEKGENARLSSFVGALAVTDLLKTTLGPRGQGKFCIILLQTLPCVSLHRTNLWRRVNSGHLPFPIP